MAAYISNIVIDAGADFDQTFNLESCFLAKGPPGNILFTASLRISSDLSFFSRS